MNPMVQLAVSCLGIIGFTTVAMLAITMLGLSLSETVPEGKTAQEYYDLGSRYKNAGWTEQSRDCLDRAIKMDPTGIGIKADLFKRTKLPRRPVPKEAIEMNVKGYNKSSRFTQNQSEEIWKECIKKYPDFEWPYSNLGSLYLEQNKLDEADKLLSKAIELNPDYVNALLFEAEVKRKQKKFDEANVLLDRVLKLEPDNSKAKMQRMLPRI